MADEAGMTGADDQAAPGWWAVREQRFVAARAALREKDVLTVLQPFGPMDNDIPGLDIHFADQTWFQHNPTGRADIYFNQGYQHNIEPLWNVVRSGRAAIKRLLVLGQSSPVHQHHACGDAV